MKTALAALWPKSLAGRLTLFLVIALALAQAGLTIFLSTQRDRVVEGLLHSQALNQTVTLARLLNQYPQAEGAQLAAAFRSRQACAWIRTGPPPAQTMSAQEQQLADTLDAMLHGIKAASTPLVAIEPAGDNRRHCGDDAAPSGTAPASHPDGGRQIGSILDGGDHSAALAMDVPLLDGRWLSVRTRVDLPPELDPITVISFVFSSVAVTIAVVLVVRHQTRSLRTLAEASERFGRGQAVAPLPVTGPVEVSIATAAFNTMQERLSEFIRDRLKLLGSISHDLRTPITTLRLKAEFIEDATVREDLIRTIDELATICEATLAFTRAEATSEETRILDLRELVAEVDQEFVLAQQPIAEIRMEPVRCSCRPVALKRALRNLIENAIRYGGAARVSVFAQDRWAVIEIEDDGPGIEPARLRDAFQPFVRLEPSRSTETGGLGLGLAIARGIVKAHGGSIGLANRPEGGLRATIRLPVAQ